MGRLPSPFERLPNSLTVVAFEVFRHVGVVLDANLAS